ncbi:MAG: hypothetical protein FWC15_09185 [Fibromonadales bacterium]|nr:hypothetical protein [Fibromonadales bacterium]
MSKAEKRQKEMDDMKAYATDFFMKDIEALKHFITKMNNEFEQNDLVFALKMFVLSSNKVFNMADFMKGQSLLAEKYVNSQKKKVTCPEERRTAFERWIKDNAASYRKNTIFKQIHCIDKMSNEIIPTIENALKT